MPPEPRMPDSDNSDLPIAIDSPITYGMMEAAQDAANEISDGYVTEAVIVAALTAALAARPAQEPVEECCMGAAPKWLCRCEKENGELARLRAENAELREAMGDLLSWFPDKPSEPEWRLTAGTHGADDAIAHARRLTGGSDG